MNPKRPQTRLVFCLLIAVASLMLAFSSFAQQKPPLTPGPKTIIQPASDVSCALLDDPRARERMDGLLFNLLWSCGRGHEIAEHPKYGEIARSILEKSPTTNKPDAQVNESSGEIGASATQNETTLAESKATGTLCSAFNDSWEFYGATGGGGFTGFSRSTDGGLTWQDGGAVGGQSAGDPSLVWREADGHFYLSTLESGGGLALWISTDDCQSFSLRSLPSSFLDDKEFLAVDNHPGSPNYGNLYLTWKDFGVVGGPIVASRSTDGGLTWSAPTTLATDSGTQVTQSPWPATAPNGDVYIALVRYANFFIGPVSIEISRSIDGGLTYFPVTPPLVNAVSPRDLGATSSCGRPALRGAIRYLASPQITVDEQGTVHVVYSYDPDGFNVGDTVDVFYRRSTNGGFSWSPEIRLNDDNSLSDQYFPTIQTAGNVLMATWYDRRNDHDNLLQEYYKRVSEDLGQTWYPSAKVSDVASPIVLDTQLAPCYHGDYDQSLVTHLALDQVVQWADDRQGDADVWAEPGECFEGILSGTWRIPTLASGNQTFTGVLKGSQRTDPAVYQLSGTATPIGGLSGTLTPVDPNAPPLTFSGTWKFNAGNPLKGSFRAGIDNAAGTQVGTLGARWNQPNLSQTGRHTGTWELCPP